MILNETYTLANGVAIPKLGLGTWFIEDTDAPQAIREAAKLGYRHFDTAQGYGNERGVGEGIRTCGVPRKELFVTTKLDASLKSHEAAKAGIAASLEALGLDYIDLMIIHSPQPWTDFRGEEHFFAENRAVWRVMEEAYHAGKLRAIGVSNFERADLDNLLEHSTVKPMVNQILAHVSNTPFDLIDYCQSQGILVEAYSPVGHGEMMKNTAVQEMAQRYNVSIPQLCIRYCLQLGMLPLPKTANPAHMENNAKLDFVISEPDMTVLKKMEQIKNYGEASQFPVYGGKLNADGSYTSQNH